jgi:transposase
MAGRPTKLTPEVQDKLVNAIKVGATYEHAADYAGIDYSTLRRWIEKGQKAKSGPFCELCDAIKRAEGGAVVWWSTQIDLAAKEGNWQAAAWKLERRYPEIYGRRVQSVEHSGKGGKPIEVRAIDYRQAIAPLAPDEDDSS